MRIKTNDFKASIYNSILFKSGNKRFPYIKQFKTIYIIL